MQIEFPEMEVELESLPRSIRREDMVVVPLPDDPKLRASSTRRRALTQRNRRVYSKVEGQARSVTKNHQHHLLHATRKTERVA